jgi:uncharacterized protein (TIGR00288 family)
MAEDLKLFALLIDGDNISALLVPQILQKISDYGNPIIKDVYVNSTSSKKWQEIINEHSLNPVWVPNNVAGKNASDIALVIDAMNLLCNRPDITGFCVVSSDSDFTRFASYVVRNNKFILGIGKEKTPVSFVNACSEFAFIKDSKLQPRAKLATSTPSVVKDKPKNTDGEQIFELLFVQAYENLPRNEGKRISLVALKDKMTMLDTEFRLIGYQNMRQVADKVEALATMYPNIIIVDRKSDENNRIVHDVYMDSHAFRFILAYTQAPEREQGGWVLLSDIGTALKRQPGFNYPSGQKNMLLNAAKGMERAFPKIIKIQKKSDGKSVTYLVQVKA